MSAHFRWRSDRAILYLLPAGRSRSPMVLARWLRFAALLWAMLLPLVAASPAVAFEPKPTQPPIDYRKLGNQVFDAVVLRPLGAGAAVIGGAAFLVVAPLASYAVGFETVWDRLVMEPVDFAFLRPLGEF